MGGPHLSSCEPRTRAYLNAFILQNDLLPLTKMLSTTLGIPHLPCIILVANNFVLRNGLFACNSFGRGRGGVCHNIA